MIAAFVPTWSLSALYVQQLSSGEEEKGSLWIYSRKAATVSSRRGFSLLIPSIFPPLEHNFWRPEYKNTDDKSIKGCFAFVILLSIAFYFKAKFFFLPSPLSFVFLQRDLPLKTLGYFLKEKKNLLQQTITWDSHQYLSSNNKRRIRPWKWASVLWSKWESAGGNTHFRKKMQDEQTVATTVGSLLIHARLIVC